MQGGVLIDVAAGELVAREHCMPRSPRCHQQRVFLRNSGEGYLCVVDLASGKLTTVAALPGTTRGLAFFGRFAFVGLSRIRESNIIGGLPITERLPVAERK